MNNPIDNSDLDALAARIAAHLVPASAMGPAGEPTPPGLYSDPRSAGPRPDFLFGSRLRIASVEYTQSIQFNGSAGQGYGPDNGVQLVAYKTMVGRGYPVVQRATLGADTLTGHRVTGELTLSIGDRVIFRAEPTRGDGARLGSSANIDRGSWEREFTLPGSRNGAFITSVPVNCPLNFMIPAYYCRPGRIYATVRLRPAAEGPSSALATSSSQYLQFLYVRAPKVCLVRISWTDSKGTVSRRTDEEMLGTLAAAVLLAPGVVGV